MKKVCETEGCDGCPMREMFPDATFVAPREGKNLRLEIGEAPGETENELGKPFAGTSGGFLRSMYHKAGLDEQANSALNVIQCQPPNNIFPTDPEARSYVSAEVASSIVKHCRNAHVLPFLRSRPWERIDLFGDKALRAIGERGGGISLWRGSILTVPALDNARIAVPTFHPAYIARDQSMLPVVVNDLRKPLVIEPERYTIYPTVEEVRSFTATRFAFDIETVGWQTGTTRISMVGLSAEDYTSIVVPFEGPYIEELKRIFINATEVIGQNLVQFDLPILAANGVVIRSPKDCMVWDIMLMHHLRFPVFPHNLEFIGKQFTNKGAWKADKVSMETYCARDVDVTFRCFEPLHFLLKQARLLDTYHYISWPMALICKLMSNTGVKRSSSRIVKLREETLAKALEAEKLLPEKLRTQQVPIRKRRLAEPGYINEKGKPAKYQMYDTFKEVVPWKSANVKKKYIYEELRDAKGKLLPERTNFKTKNLTANKIALDWLYARYKLPQLKALKELNGYSTLLSGFAKGDVIEDDVLHPSFNVHGTEAGRLSSSGPNFQNQPPSVRFSYVPRNSGGRIISVDYSGIENRLVAHSAKDRKRQVWFKDAKFSEHKYLAGLLGGIAYEDVEKSKEKDSDYAIAKVIVHGTDRMMGSLKISNQYDIEFVKAKDFQATWKKEIQDTIAWQRRIGADCARVGHVTNAFGRKLWLWETNSATRAVSFIPQSTAADVIFRVMIALMYERIDWPKEWAEKVVKVIIPLPEEYLLLAQVHDELVIETENEEQVEPCLKILRQVMQQPWPELDGLSLPIGEAWGESWGDCE